MAMRTTGLVSAPSVQSSPKAIPNDTIPLWKPIRRVALDIPADRQKVLIVLDRKTFVAIDKY